MRNNHQKRYQPKRVVITGVGVVSPIGIGTTSFWNNLKTGKAGIGQLQSVPAEQLPCKLAAEIRDFDPARLLPEKKHLKVMSRDIQLGVASASLAMTDADLERNEVDPDRLGVIYGAGRISTTPQELAEAVRACSEGGADFELTRWGEDAMGRIAPLWLLRQLPNMPACHVSIEYNARGPNNTITSRDSSAILALNEAICCIERGAADAMIVGACGSNIDPVDIARMSLFEGLSRRADDPEHACRPFDFDRDGTIVGEGAATFVVEDYDHAVRRGADIYCEILGTGSGCDGSGFANEAGGTGLVRAITQAMNRAGIGPRELGHINAHGKSTQSDDLVESRAYHRVFGNDTEKIPVTALKSYFGHCDAGSGAVELAGSVLALRHGELPMTLNYEIPDPRCRINVVHDEPLRLRTRAALSVNRTNVGQSAAVVVRAV